MEARTAPGEFFAIPAAAVAAHYKCAWGGAEQISVWEHVESYEAGMPPDYTCCLRCNEMIDNRTGEVIT